MNSTSVAPLQAALYVVATPIGNLADISDRARATLARVDLIAAEDTRSTRHLLQALAIERPTLIASHAHNERSSIARITAAIAEGQACALVSDAGTPAISDPGARLVHGVRAAGHRIVPIPGVSALVTLLSVAGIDADHYGDAANGFYFEGFLPSKAGARERRVRQLLAMGCAIVLYEAPHRIAASLACIASHANPPRQIVIGRELTKRFEEIACLPSDEAVQWVSADPNRSRGEFVILIAPTEPRTASPDAIDLQETIHSSQTVAEILSTLAAELPPRKAAKIAASITGLPSKPLYAYLVSKP